VRGVAICGLARTGREDVERAARALEAAARPRIHTFIATSDIHLDHKLRMSRSQVLEEVDRAVRQACSYVEDVEFSAEDATRSDWDYLVEVFRVAIDAGARTLNVPDTVGYTQPDEYARLIRYLRENVPDATRAIFSVHCHNDLGLAVANSLAAVMNGARQVECTVNGLGERAGNASLEEIVMAVPTRQDVFTCDTRLDSTQIVPASRLVSGITGFPVQPNKAIVGANAFAHEAGIHQDGVLKSRETYEIMRAQDVGWAANKLVLGKHSGRNAFKQRLKELGIDLESDDAYNKAFQRFKELADKKHEIFDEDLQALVSDEADAAAAERWKLVSLQQESGTSKRPHASIVLTDAGAERPATSEGDGPVDAIFKAIETVATSGAELQLYSVNAVTQGTESQGEVTVRLAKGGRVVNGVGSDTDIVVASAKAYVNALNRLQDKMERINPQR